MDAFNSAVMRQVQDIVRLVGFCMAYPLDLIMQYVQSSMEYTSITSW